MRDYLCFLYIFVPIKYNNILVLYILFNYVFQFSPLVILNMTLHLFEQRKWQILLNRIFFHFHLTKDDLSIWYFLFCCWHLKILKEEVNEGCFGCLDCFMIDFSRFFCFVQRWDSFFNLVFMSIVCNIMVNFALFKLASQINKQNIKFETHLAN